MLLALCLLPAAAGLVSFLLRSARALRWALLFIATVHIALVALVWMTPPAPECGGWLILDHAGKTILTITSIIFFACSFYCFDYLRREKALHEDASQSRFVGCILLFFAAMNLVCLVQNLGLLWVAIEATTLASAPLIYFHRTRRSLEATWKYLMICSVGIALALIGNFAFILASAHQLPLVWLKAGFIFLLVGYGTKMGLAPIHSWLPDAHSEAPSPISALLSGALLNCAFLGIWRGYQVLRFAGLSEFGGDLLMVLGFLSLAVAAVFLLRSTDFKRMLAYSSVENMGLLAIGIGAGGAGTQAAFLHAANHSLTKSALFLLAGNILSRFHTKSTESITGLSQEMPLTGAMWFAGILAILGMPPFGIFVSKFAILKSAFDRGGAIFGLTVLVFLAIVFIGMVTVAMRMVQGPASLPSNLRKPEAVLSVAPAFLLLVGTLVLCFYVPPFLFENP